MVKEFKIGKDRKSDRIFLFIAAVIIFYSLIILRLFYMQIVDEEKYKEIAESNSRKTKVIKAQRGKIYDRYGRLLATNVAGYKVVYLLGNNAKDHMDKVKKIAELTGESEEKIKKSIETGEVFRYTGENEIINDYPEEKAHKLIEKLSDYPYLNVIYYTKRKYLNGNMASHVLGYVRNISPSEYEKLKDKGYNSTDVIGKKGIEKQYDDALRGKDGYEYIEVNSRNKLVKKLDTKPAVPGKDIYLTIDMELQNYVTETMKGFKGAAILMDIKTGEIIAMVSVPEYDIVKFSSKLSGKEWQEIQNNPAKPMLNRATVGEYPPGSIFKPISALAVLESGISPKETIFDLGYFTMGSIKWACWEPRGHGVVNLEKSLMISCNVYYYNMGKRIGYEKIAETARRFGLGAVTGIDIPEEKDGNIPDKEWKKKKMKQPWYGGDTINMVIGQGYVLATPMQMVRAYAMFANNGIGYKPRLVDKMIGNDSIIEYTKPENNLNISIKDEYKKILGEALRKTVTNGTAGRVNNILGDIEVAAKTGSAQNSQSKLTHAWMAGYAPYKKPEIAFVVLVEGSGHGGTIAGPIARQMLEKYFEIKRGEKNGNKGNSGGNSN